jgi:multiple antibiotic resistance protein
MIEAMLDQFLYAFGTLVALILPFAELPVFLQIMEGRSAKELRRAAFTVSVGSFAILATSALAGRLILQVFGVSFPAFRAAGGLVLIVIGLEMLKGQASAVTLDARLETDPADRLWMPFVMPLIAGPAAITATVALAIRERAVAHHLPAATLLAVAAATLLVYVILLVARPLAAAISGRGARLFERFLGLILVAVGFQMGMTGVYEFFDLGPTG